MANLVNTIRGMFAPIVEETKIVNEAPEDKEPASPDEAQMAMKQLEFIEYAADELKDYIKSRKEFPEWMQNKLSKLHGDMEGLHSAMGEHGEDEEEMEGMEEALDPSEIAGNPKMYDAATVKKAYYHKKVTADDKAALERHLDRHHGNKQWRKPVKEEIDMEGLEEGFVVKYHTDKGEHKNTSRVFADKAAADAHAKRGNSVDKVGGKYTVHKVNAKGAEVKEEVELEEATAEQINKVLDSTKSASEGLAALKKAFKVDDKGAKALMKKVMGEEIDFENLEEGWEDMMKAVRDRAKPQPSGGAGKKAGRAYGGANQKDKKKQQDEALSPKQKQLDVDKDGDIEGDDLKALRDKKKKPGTSGKAEPVEVNPKLNEETDFLNELLEGSEMTDAEMKKREKIVKSMKKKTADFKSRYGDRWKSVMYATATKMANK